MSAKKNVRYFNDAQTLNEKGAIVEKRNDIISEEKISKYLRGENVVQYIDIKSKYQRTKEIQREKKLHFAAETTARAEILLPEESGYIVPDEDEQTFDITQRDIANQVDISTAQKYFNLKLEQFGPYSFDYTRNGRSLLIGGTRGHLAAFDWHSKQLKFEINVMEAINCVKWLHTENMLAVGQKKWAHIYDNQGIEIHCLKKLFSVLQMEFLPYHFLLAASNSRGFISWLDISVGKIISNFYTGLGTLDVMCQNPQNAIVCLGASNGTVTMWSPNNPKPLATLLCHRSPVRSVAVDHKGIYMATSDTDGNLHIWDVRNFQILDTFKLTGSANQITYSQTQLLSVSTGQHIEIYKDSCLKEASPYMIYDIAGSHVKNLKFCPYEDVLGIGHSNGFTSIIVPGAGEANYDSYEANPFQTKTQRKEWEVKALLGKVQPELISLESGCINKVNILNLQEKLEQRNKIMGLKPKKIDIHIKKRKFKKAASARKVAARKQEILLDRKKDYFENLNLLNEHDGINATAKQDNDKDSPPNHQKVDIDIVPSALDRFKTKKKKYVS